MTKTDWTAEEVRAMAEKLSADVPRFNTEDERLCAVDMLTALAERIEAPESAAPVAWMRRTIRHKRIGGREEGERVMSASKVYPDDEPLFTHPPAQPAQEQPGWKVPDAFVKLHEAASKGFHTSESCGPESLYMHKSKFPTLQDLFDFEDAWRKAMLAASPPPPKEN